MRWILVIVALLGLSMAIMAKSPGALGFGLVLAFVGAFAALLAFAANRIAATSRSETSLLTDKDIAALRASMRKPAAPNPPPKEPA